MRILLCLDAALTAGKWKAFCSFRANSKWVYIGHFIFIVLKVDKSLLR